jgi:hypothetical protein
MVILHVKACKSSWEFCHLCTLQRTRGQIIDHLVWRISNDDSSKRIKYVYIIRQLNVSKVKTSNDFKSTLRYHRDFQKYQFVHQDMDYC